MTLHNFIRQSKLRDKEFDKCDADENYIPGAGRATPLLGDDIALAVDENTMNTTRERIANSLMVGRQT
jgi:hypothetical protein